MKYYCSGQSICNPRREGHHGRPENETAKCAANLHFIGVDVYGKMVRGAVTFCGLIKQTVALEERE